MFFFLNLDTISNLTTSLNIKIIDNCIIFGTRYNNNLIKINITFKYIFYTQQKL